MEFDYSDRTKQKIDYAKLYDTIPSVTDGYVSPIQTIASQIEMTYENEVYKAVQRVGIEVDKDELLKALQYDRQQYAEGFRNGYERGLQVSQSEIDKFIGYLDDDMVYRIKLAIERRADNGN